MSISRANELMSQGEYSEAEALYRKLYQETGLNIYKFGLEYAIKKDQMIFQIPMLYLRISLKHLFLQMLRAIKRFCLLQLV